MPADMRGVMADASRIECNKRHAAQNARLGWCPCGSEESHECECGLQALSVAQGLSGVDCIHAAAPTEGDGK